MKYIIHREKSFGLLVVHKGLGDVTWFQIISIIPCNTTPVSLCFGVVVPPTILNLQSRGV